MSDTTPFFKWLSTSDDNIPAANKYRIYCDWLSFCTAYFPKSLLKDVSSVSLAKGFEKHKEEIIDLFQAVSEYCEKNEIKTPISQTTLSQFFLNSSNRIFYEENPEKIQEPPNIGSITDFAELFCLNNKSEILSQITHHVLFLESICIYFTRCITKETAHRHYLTSLSAVQKYYSIFNKSIHSRDFVLNSFSLYYKTSHFSDSYTRTLVNAFEVIYKELIPLQFRDTYIPEEDTFGAIYSHYIQ